MGERSSGTEVHSGSWLDERAVISLVVFGLWNAITPFAGHRLGLEVDTRTIVEVVDHVIPGLVVLLVAALSSYLGRVPLTGWLVVVLAGFWATATHLPLLMQVPRDQVGLPTALWHAAPGILLLGFAAAGAARSWKEEA